MSSRAFLTLVALLIGSTATHAQDRLRTMPGYERYAAMAPTLASSIKSGAITPQWAEDGGSFDFTRDGKRLRYTVATKAVTEAGPANSGATMGARRLNAPARGRQYTEAWTADSAMKAVYRENNLFISARDGSGERQLTTDGSTERRIKYGTASWVYGEELDQVTAMWWSPSGKQLAYYRFDENPVKDYWLQMDQTAVQGSV
ncbi:MAG: DPP IV N-terminal domain-containing protein, partial [Gemmatimonadaceae bacterium]